MTLIGTKSINAMDKLSALVINGHNLKEASVGQRSAWVNGLAQTSALMMNTLANATPVGMDTDAEDVALAATIAATVLSTTVAATNVTNLNATIVAAGAAYGFTGPVLV
jgi:hypothetical protein